MAEVKNKEAENAAICKMLYCKSPVGTKRLEDKMKVYAEKRTTEGVHLINPIATLEKLDFAALTIAGSTDPKSIYVISARPYGGRAILKFAHYAGISAVSRRWTPGMLTNPISENYIQASMLLVTDPVSDAQAVAEAGYANVPVIALCDTDSPLRNIDIAVPCNNKGRDSIAFVYWYLARQVLRYKGLLERNQAWDVMIDMFVWKDPSEFDAKQPEEAPEAPHVEEQQWGGEAQADEWGGAAKGAAQADWTAAAAGGEWKTAAPGGEEWGGYGGGEKW